MSQYDSIIIGAGHNGLVCAAYLAKAGQRVLVLEAGDQPGGLAAQREFHPGFTTPVAHSVSHFAKKIAADLDLASHGFVPPGTPLPLVGLAPDRAPVIVSENAAEGVSENDAAALDALRGRLLRFARALAPFWLKTIPRIGGDSLGDMMTFAHLGLNIRRLGKRDMEEFLRIASLPMRDLMDENFNDDLLKAMLSWDGIIGSRLAPRSPNSSVLALLYRLSGGQWFGHAAQRAESGNLGAALAAAASTAGAEIRCGSKVDRVLVSEKSSGLDARGVRLASGEEIDAARVVSAVDPQRTFLKLVGVEYFDIGFTNRIRRLRCEGLVGKLHLALDGMPEFAGVEDAGGRMILASTMDDIEFAYDDAKYGACSEKPVLEVVVPSIHDASFAPQGKHVLSAHVMYVPYTLKGGWTDEARNTVYERSLDMLEICAPGLRSQVITGEFLTPLDIEREYRVTGGHWHHTEFAMDQMLMMRPTYEAAQYGTPLPGLTLCGAGCHPGGDLTGAAGHNAAEAILR